MMQMVKSGLSFERSQAFDPGGMLHILSELAASGMLTVTPLLLALVIAALSVPFLMGGWVFSVKALRFDLTRLDPLQGLAGCFRPTDLLNW
jgi:flagellar biosynthetic protein FlhB